MTNNESFTNFKLIIAKYDKNLLQIVWQVLQSETKFIKKYDRYFKVWQEVIAKFDKYCEMWQLLKSET